MPRKNARPAAKKRREKLKSKMTAGSAKRQVAFIAHAGTGAPNMALLAFLAAKYQPIGEHNEP